MIWKTTLEKIFLPVSQAKNKFRQPDLWRIFNPSSGLGLLICLFTVSLTGNAQNSQSSISGDNCIDFNSCPADQTVCANAYEDGVYGAYVYWTDPVVTQTCTPNGRPGNFQMLFELNEQLLTVDCWDFNYISRVGTDGGQVKLFSGEDGDKTKNSVIITPYLILKPGSETSIDVDYVNGDYTVQLSLIDENGDVIPMNTPPQTVDGNNLTYTFFTPNTETGIYRLKFVFEYSGKEPSNANNGDTLIAVDGMLSPNDDCSAGVDFTVSPPRMGFYPVGSHDLQYVATYTAPDGTIKTKTCSFNITVTDLELNISNLSNATCGTNDGSFTAAATGVAGTETNPITYSIDGIDFQGSGTFNNLAPATYTVIAKDATGCTVQTEVIITQPVTPSAPVANTPTQPTCEVATGSFTVQTVSGLEYSIDGTTWNTDGVFNDLTEDTTYDVLARNADGCVSEPTQVQIEAQPETPAAPTVNTPVQPTCEVATGSFTVVTVAGLEYSIDGTTWNTDGIFNDLTEDTLYNVVARSAEGCISDATLVQIDAQPETPPAPEMTIVVSPSCGEEYGSFGICCDLGYEYSIDGENFKLEPIFDNLLPGTYYVVARNDDGCISEATEVIIEPAPETPSAPVVNTPTQPTCETATGSFTVETMSGLEYSIDGTIWNTDGIFSNLTEDTLYNVVARNADGCISETTQVQIDAQPETPEAPIANTPVQPTCEVATGSFTVQTVAGLEYSINGTDWRTDGVFNDLTENTTYDVVARNADGCISSPTPVQIDAQPETPEAPIANTPVQPTCEVATGSFTVQTIAGLEYSVDGTNWNTDGIFNNLTEDTTYDVVARNADGCISSPTPVQIDAQPETPAAPSVNSPVQPTCDVATGSFTVVTVPGLEYSIDGTNWRADGTFTDLAEATSYNVVARNADGCISEVTQVQIDAQPETPAAPSVNSPVQPTCEVPTGSFTVNTEAGMEYSIDGTNWRADGTFTDLTEATTYNVVAKNADGCISEATQVQIDAQPETPAAPSVNSPVQPTCEVPTGSFTVNTEAGMEYSIDQTNWNTDGIFEGLFAKTYDVVARNGDGCISDATQVTIIAQPGTPEVPEVASISQPTCTNATGSFTVTVESGLEYSIDLINWNTDGIFKNLADDSTYNVVARNADGCISQATPVNIIAQPETPASPSIREVTQPSCTIATASFSIVAVTGLEYSIDGNTWNTDGVFNDLTEATTYNVVARNTDGCISESTSVQIEAQPETPAAPTVSSTAQPTCTVATGSFSLATTAGMEYSIDGNTWNTDGVFNDLTEETIYNVVARNADGCISEPTSVQIEAQPETPEAPVILTTIHPSCDEVYGAFGICCDTGMEYSIDGVNFQLEPFFMDLAPGYYEVVARNAEGCISEPTPVTINPAPETPAAPSVADIVQPTCDSPTGSFTVEVVQGLEYSIDGTDFNTTGEFLNLNPDIYEVVARNADGCISASTSVTIEAQPNTPQAPTVTAAQPSCTLATGSVNVSLVEGLEYSINGTDWFTNGVFNDLEADTTYQVFARNAEGCLSSPTSVTINEQPATPAAPAVASTVQPTCSEPTGAFSITAMAGLEYSIDGTNWFSNGIFNDLTADTVYEVYARNANGCVSEPTEVSISAQPQTPAAPQVASITQPDCTDASGSFTLTAIEGLEYSINNIDWNTDGVFYNLEENTLYTVLARNANGCTSEATPVQIDAQPETPAAPAVSSTTQPTCTDPNGAFTVTVVEGLEYSIDGTNWNTDGIFTQLDADSNYEVVARNADGCVSAAISVSINASPETPAAPEIEDFMDATCEEPTGMVVFPLLEGIVYSMTDADGNTISDDNNDAIYNDLQPGAYSVTAENTDGCISEPTPVTISSPQLEEITPSSGNVCIEETSYNLTQLLGEADTSGTWEDPENTGALENASINPSLLAVGTYTFNYVLTFGECTSTTSVNVTINDDCVVLPCELEDVKSSISKVVTPNGDNINDKFTIGLDLDCGFIYNVKIFNRWGALVYEADNYQNNWDGTSRTSVTGDQLPAGTYYYMVDIIGLEPVQGYIYLGTK